MYNRHLVNIVGIAGIVEILGFLYLSYLYNIIGSIDIGQFWVYLSVFSAVTQVPFYGVMFYYQNYQKRYLFYAAFAVVTLITFIPFLAQFVSDDFEYIGSTLADINFIALMVALFLAAKISVDDGTFKSTKRLIMWNTVHLLVFKTPTILWLVHFVSGVFRGTNSHFPEIVFTFVVIQFILSGVLSFFKAKEVNEVDFM